MSEKTVYISYRPEQSLHIAQPLFNGLRAIGYNVFMDIDEGVDAVNLGQVTARDHFIILLTPGALEGVGRSGDRLTEEFKVAVEYQRNIMVLYTRDFDITREAKDLPERFTGVLQVPRIQLQPKQFQQTVSLLNEDYLQKEPGRPSVPTPADDAEIVHARINKAREYTQQTTIRLNTEKMFFQAVVKIRRGDYQEALNDLDLVIADNPNNESAYLQRGRVLRKLGRKTAALKDYEQATRLSPKLVAAHIGRGELLLETERHHQALDAFQMALKLQEESAPAIAGLALTHYALDEIAEGLRLWDWLTDRDANYNDPQWTGEVFDWDDPLVNKAAELLAKRGSI